MVVFSNFLEAIKAANYRHLVDIWLSTFKTLGCSMRVKITYPYKILPSGPLSSKIRAGGEISSTFQFHAVFLTFNCSELRCAVYSNMRNT